MWPSEQKRGALDSAASWGGGREPGSGFRSAGAKSSGSRWLWNGRFEATRGRHQYGGQESEGTSEVGTGWSGNLSFQRATSPSRVNWLGCFALISFASPEPA